MVCYIEHIMPMHTPVHPGVILKHDCIDAVGLSITEAARVLGVTRQTLSRVINAQTALSPEMAIRVSKAFGSTPEHWLRLQLAYDVAQMRDKADRIQVQRYVPPAAVTVGMFT
jgi:antitoxin HigA-1